jgi:hypothetical protein
MKLISTLMIILGFLPHAVAQPVARNVGPQPEVEWYPIETEKSQVPQRSKVIISGKTRPQSVVRIDGDTITILKPQKAAGPAPVIESVETRSNSEGFFEVAMNLPQGLMQMPVEVTTPTNSQKTFLLTFDVNLVKDQIQMKTKTSTSKPPAAAKRFRLWAGAGWTYQSLNQSAVGSSDLKFQTVQAPGIVARGGYWGERWGLDFYFRDAPGKIEADRPLTVQTDTYHWRTMEAKGLYQFDRNAKSRIFGLASQWQVRFGAQVHETPFVEIDPSNNVTLENNSFTMGTLGVGLLLGQEQAWSYEFALGIQQPVSAKGPGTNFKASSAFGYEAQLGAAYKFAPNWRLGAFSYTQSLSYAYEYQNLAGLLKTGKQNLFYTTFDLRLGYEF